MTASKAGELAFHTDLYLWEHEHVSDEDLCLWGGDSPLNYWGHEVALEQMAEAGVDVDARDLEAWERGYRAAADAHELDLAAEAELAELAAAEDDGE